MELLSIRLLLIFGAFFKFPLKYRLLIAEILFRFTKPRIAYFPKIVYNKDIIKHYITI